MNVQKEEKVDNSLGKKDNNRQLFVTRER